MVEIEWRDWSDGSIIMISMQVEDSSFILRTHVKNPGKGVHTSNHSSGEVETGGSLDFSGYLYGIRELHVH